MASLTKRCRHRGPDREACNCAWLIRYRVGKREQYIGAGKDKTEALRLLALHREAPPKPREIARAPGLTLPTQKGTSWVYFIAGAGLVKIGRTCDLDLRLRDIQTTSPVVLTLMLVVEGARDVEKTFHVMFDPYRRHGEWFALPVGWENDPRILEMSS